MPAISFVVFYALDPRALAAFWGEALGYRIGLDEGKLVVIVDPAGHGTRIAFRHTPVPKRDRNRVHLDVAVWTDRQPILEELDVERVRLEALGATTVRLIDQPRGAAHELYYQMLDPEGNEFCLQ